MDESDSDDASDAGDATKPHIPGETAFEREKRLAEQAEHEEERLKTAKLKALFNERARPDSKSGKRKAADIDEDEYSRRAARQRIKKDDGGESGRRGATARKERKYRELSHSPLHDGDDQAKRDDGKLPGTLQEYERVRVGRTSFPQVCFFPGFEDTFVGAYARVCHGQDPVTGQNIYRMCQIKGNTCSSSFRRICLLISNRFQDWQAVQTSSLPRSRLHDRSIHHCLLRLFGSGIPLRSMLRLKIYRR